MKKISNEELLADLEQTETELLAYGKLHEGFAILAQIPENIESGKAKIYSFESSKYYGFEQGCAKLFHKLQDLKLKRKIR